MLEFRVSNGPIPSQSSSPYFPLRSSLISPKMPYFFLRSSLKSPKMPVFVESRIRRRPIASQSSLSPTIIVSAAVFVESLTQIWTGRIPSQSSSPCFFTGKGLSSNGLFLKRMDSGINHGSWRSSCQSTIDPGNKGRRRDLKLMKLEHDYILAKMKHAKLKDQAFTRSVLLVILLGLNVLLAGTKVLGMWVMVGSNTELVGGKVGGNIELVGGEVGGNIEVGGDTDVGKGLLKLVLNKLPITLEFILGTTVSALVTAFLNYSSSKYELEEAKEKLRFTELELKYYKEECKGDQQS